MVSKWTLTKKLFLGTKVVLTELRFKKYGLIADSRYLFGFYHK